MEIVRIPRTYSTQIQYLSDIDMSYIFKNLFLLSEGEVIDVEDSMRGGLLKSIWREVVQMENKARAKKGEKGLCYELATLRVDTESNLERSKSATKSKQVKSSQDKTSNIVSEETKELALTKKNPDIDLLIETLKIEADSLGIAYDKKQERNFGKHITTAKEFGNFCEKVGQERIEFAKNIMKASVKINYWKGACSGPMSIYQNYSEVYNQTKGKSEKTKQDTIIITNEI